MLKFLLVIALLTGVCFFFSSSMWDISLQMLGYEITFPLSLVILALFLLCFVWSLIKKPFVWIQKFRAWRSKKKQQNKEAFLLRVLNTLCNFFFQHLI